MPQHRKTRQSHSTAQHITSQHTHIHSAAVSGSRTHVTSRVAIQWSRLQQITDGSERGQVKLSRWVARYTAPTRSPPLAEYVLVASASASGWSYSSIGSVVVEHTTVTQTHRAQAHKPLNSRTHRKTYKPRPQRHAGNDRTTIRRAHTPRHITYSALRK